MKQFLAAAIAVLTMAAATVTSVAQTCPNDYPRTQGYWKTHPEAWPVSTLDVSGSEMGADFILESVLNQPSHGNPEMILLKQLIPAKLNMAMGVNGSAVHTYMVDAEDMLEDFVYAMGHGDAESEDDDSSDYSDDDDSSDSDDDDSSDFEDENDDRQKMIDIAARLDEFNNGAFCSLPVELTDFDAQADGTLVTLRWSTASEENNAGFELQHRRGNGYGFESVEFISGKGTTNVINSYAVSLSNLGFGKHTFRLRQVDLDGTFSYSSEVELDVELTEKFALTEAYPNPFNPTTNIRFSLREAGEIHLAVFDIVGRHVKTLATGNFSAGSHDVSFSADNLPSGTYVYRLRTEAGLKAGTLILLK
ncbi:MAG: T9SS type A sorting domain-containing protein [Rhodothermia bacterium]|nr:T9SS type A sorting domain-containing protein [Rhodothermia bacterium]